MGVGRIRKRRTGGEDGVRGTGMSAGNGQWGSNGAAARQLLRNNGDDGRCGR